MNYYFISDTKYHLKINGNYLGKVGKNLLFTENVSNPAFFEFLPTSDDYYPLYTDLEDKTNVKTFSFLDGEVIIPLFKKRLHSSFKVLGQKQFFIRNSPNVLSVVVDGSNKFYVDGSVTLIDKLPFTPENFEVFECNNYTFFSFHGQKTLLIGYDFTGLSKKMIYKDVVDDFEIKNNLTTRKRYDLTNPLIITEEWEITSPLNLISRTTNLEKSVYDVPKQLLPLSFIETLSVKGDVTEYLSPQLKERASDLYEFIGSPIYAFTSPKNLLDVVCITKDKLSIYSLEFKDNLVSNIIEK